LRGLELREHGARCSPPLPPPVKEVYGIHGGISGYDIREHGRIFCDMAAKERS